MTRRAHLLALTLLLPLTIMLALAISAHQADGHLAYRAKGDSLKQRERTQERNLAHARYVASRGEGKNRRWHRKAVRWIKPELAETRRLLEPAHPVVDGCLSRLIEEESGWDHTATNPVTGAYGLPQALPGSKMASAGPDWRTNPATQIRWMIGYVNGRYGGSCGALAFFYANGWY